MLVYQRVPPHDAFWPLQQPIAIFIEPVESKYRRCGFFHTPLLLKKSPIHTLLFEDDVYIYIYVCNIYIPSYPEK